MEHRDDFFDQVNSLWRFIYCSVGLLVTVERNGFLNGHISCWKDTWCFTVTVSKHFAGQVHMVAHLPCGSARL